LTIARLSHVQVPGCAGRIICTRCGTVDEKVLMLITYSSEEADKFTFQAEQDRHWRLRVAASNPSRTAHNVVSCRSRCRPQKAVNACDAFSIL
jgi:hypothetical protein